LRVTAELSHHPGRKAAICLFCKMYQDLSAPARKLYYSGHLKPNLGVSYK